MRCQALQVNSLTEFWQQYYHNIYLKMKEWVLGKLVQTDLPRFTHLKTSIQARWPQSLGSFLTSGKWNLTLRNIRCCLWVLVNSYFIFCNATSYGVECSLKLVLLGLHPMGFIKVSEVTFCVTFLLLHNKLSPNWAS